MMRQWPSWPSWRRAQRQSADAGDRVGAGARGSAVTRPAPSQSQSAVVSASERQRWVGDVDCANASAARVVTVSPRGARWRRLRLSLCVSLCLSVSLSLCLSVFVRGGAVWGEDARVCACVRACAVAIVERGRRLAIPSCRRDLVHCVRLGACQPGLAHAEPCRARTCSAEHRSPGLRSCCTVRCKAGWRTVWRTVSKQRLLCVRPCSTAPAKWAQFDQCLSCRERRRRRGVLQFAPCLARTVRYAYSWPAKTHTHSRQTRPDDQQRPGPS